MDNILIKLREKLGEERVESQKEITYYFTMRTVAKAEYFFQAETRDDLIDAVKAARELDIPLFMLGGGSNIAILHDEIKGLVVRNVYHKKEIKNETDEYVDMLISSGYPVSRLAMETAKEGLEGIEYHFGLPGTVGGGIAMNSKWVGKKNLKIHNEETAKQYAALSQLQTVDTDDKFPKYMGDPLLSATLIDKEGNTKEVDQEYFRFAYDYSILKDTKEIFLEGVFRLYKKDPVLLEQRARDSNAFRKVTQLVGVATCGCMFQNISEEEKEKRGLPTQSAGYLIDKSGLKNTQVGEFIVSEKHANFIVNTGKGKPEDLLKLVGIIKGKVKETFDIDLQEEVILV